MVQVASVCYFLVLAIFLFQPVACSLYPTKPIADTTYTAGQPAEVTWIDDGQKPLLNESIGFRIDLYAGNKVVTSKSTATLKNVILYRPSRFLLWMQTYIATLSKDADPRSLYTTVYIPLYVPVNFRDL